MVEEETVVEAVGEAVNESHQPEEVEKTITDKKDVEENGDNDMEDVEKEDVGKDMEVDKKESPVKETEPDKKEIEKDQPSKTDEENNSEEEKDDEKEDKHVKANDKKDSVEEKVSEKVEEKTEVSSDEEEKKQESKKEEEEEEEPKKHRRRKSSTEKEETEEREVGEKNVKEPVTPTVFSLDRPVRQRKSVERLVAVVEKDTTKGIRIEKGRGTALMDIPNVAYKLTKKKTDETFKMLHVILFGRKAKEFKNNLSQFSGFAWHENEEKQKSKIKEKLDKYVKEKLLEFCDVLDIRVAKATSRKEEIVTELLEFLAAPRARTDVLLADKEQLSKGTKRKRTSTKVALTSGGTTAKRSPRKRRKTDDPAKDKEKSSNESEEESEKDEKENENEAPDASEDELDEHLESEDKEDNSEEETVKQKKVSVKPSAEKEASGKTVSKKTATPKKDNAISSPRKSKSSKGVKSDTSPTVSSKKTKDVETVKRKRTTPSKSATKEKDSKEKAGKKVVKSKVKDPSEDELRNAIIDILKEVDFNTATFTDILKALAKRYEVDLTPRKTAIKTLIQEELTKLAEEEDDDDDEDEGEEAEPEKEEVKA